MIKYVSEIVKQIRIYEKLLCGDMAVGESERKLNGRVYWVSLKIVLKTVDAEDGGFAEAQRIITIGCDYPHVRCLMRVLGQNPPPRQGEETRTYCFHDENNTVIEAITAICDTERVLAEAVV